MIYVPTGQDDVFAVSVDTGEILWEYKAHLDQTISVVCCGWESRGVALGDGKVYIGQLDGKLVALDQKTGQVAWKTQVARWQDGYSITARAALRRRHGDHRRLGRRVRHARQRHRATTRTTGKQLWRFYTIPGPGETGHDTWPQTSDAWKARRRAGLADAVGRPEARAALLHDRQRRPATTTAASAPARTCSPRRWSRSTCKTGKLKWWYQMVHHDIWDYDAPSPTVLFDAKVNGNDVHGHRRGREDRLALPPEPRDRQAAVPDAGEEGAAERGPEDLADAAVPAATRRSCRTRCRRRSIKQVLQGREGAVEAARR